MVYHDTIRHPNQNPISHNRRATELSEWVAEYQSERRDKQIEEDYKAGRFDALIAEAKAQVQADESTPI